MSARLPHGMFGGLDAVPTDVSELQRGVAAVVEADWIEENLMLSCGRNVLCRQSLNFVMSL
jgi:hypothetical protein